MIYNPPPAEPGGFLEKYLVRHGYNYWDSMFFQWIVDWQTSWNVGDSDPATGTILDISEQIIAYGTLGTGAGGGPYTLCQLVMLDADGDAFTDPSVIDLFGPPRPPVIVENPMYLTVDGTWHEAEVVTDGAYVAETPEKVYMDSYATYDPLSPITSNWHELWPNVCPEWHLTSWDDNIDVGLSESDQIDMEPIAPPGDLTWYHVDWVNPAPVPGDGKADLILTKKPPTPEFPIGINLLMLLTLTLPLAYLWRLRRKVTKQ